LAYLRCQEDISKVELARFLKIISVLIKFSFEIHQKKIIKTNKKKIIKINIISLLPEDDPL